MPKFTHTRQPAIHEPARLSSWEVFLLNTGVPETNCITLLSRRSRKGLAISTWVNQNYATKFVPENILDAVRLRSPNIARWQVDE